MSTQHRVGRRRRRVIFPLALAFLASLPAAAQPPGVRDLAFLPGDPVVGPATNSQVENAIARGGNQFLVAWTDLRPRSSGSQTVQADADIFGIRLDANGTPIDAAPFLIAGGMGYQQRPSIAWNGENYLVLYQSQDPTEFYYDTFIRAVRVSAQGQVLDPTPLSFPPDLFSPSTIGLTVSGQGGQWLAARCVYHGDGYGTFLAGQRIASDGRLIDPAPVMLIDWVYGQLQVIPSNGEYLVVGPDWNNGSTLKARRIASNLQPLAPAFNLPTTPQSIAGNGAGEFYVTWIANFTDLVGSRMTNTGTLLTPAGTLLVPNFAGDLRSTHDGTNWWLSWSVSTNARTMRISPAGSVLDPGGVLLPIALTGNVTSLYTPALVPRPAGGTIFAWSDYRQTLGNDPNVFALPISAANAAASETCVSTGTSNQRNPDFSIGPNGTSAVAFVSEFANDDRVLVHFLNPLGTPTTPQPIEVVRTANIGKAGIAWNGSLFLVAWDQGPSGLSTTGIKARRMNPDGTFIDAAPFDVMPGFNADVEALASDFLVAGARFGTYPQNIYLVGNRIDGVSGTLRDGPNGLLLGGFYVSGIPRVRTDDTQWFVAAHSQWSHDSSQGDAILARVPLVGTPTQAGNPTPVAGGSGDLDIAWSGRKYLLVWRMNSLANANNYVAGRIMNADGTFPPGYFTIAEATGRQLRPTVAWDGTNFLVAWDDQRNQGSFFDARTDIYAARVSEAGAVLDPQAFPIVRGPHAECSPALHSRNGYTLAASTRYVVSAGFDSYRVALSALGAPPCVADMDDGSGSGTPDGGVTIDDLLFYLAQFEAGLTRADVDNGTFTNTPDGGVTIDDLLYYLFRFEAGC